ncbi:MAG: ribosomal protein S18-alanine N-acetyltransferase [Candidatus Zixiibacteriota bacterium]
MLREIDRIIIRGLTPADLEEIAALEKSCFSDPWSKENFQEELQHQFTIPLVVEADQKIVGYACLWNVDGQMEIANFAVALDYRRKGIGRMMMERVILESVNRGCSSVILSVRESNLSARNLYHEFGFAEISRRKRYYRLPVEDAIIMVKNL